jgi:iron complex outermembrane receptor protein
MALGLVAVPAAALGKRDWNVKNIYFSGLKAGVAPMVLGLALYSGQAYAQDNNAVDCTATPNAAGCAPANAAATNTNDNTIVVTGSILRRTSTETPSPVTQITAQSLEERGINTVAEALQRIPANNAGTIQQGWNTGFNFAAGANAPALRGLTVQSTLSIVDGLRVAPYPIADDGQRNFVDLSTIPDAIVDRIEVLRDGASATYGADAIAGVINVITKKEIQGLHIGGSFGTSQKGDAEEYRADVTWGYGDLAEQGFNFYISAEWMKSNALFARDRGYPFNTSDWQQKCGASGSCLPNLNWNGITAEDGFFNAFVTIPGVTMIRPYQANGTTTAGGYQFANPAAGCRQWDFISGADILSQTGSGAFPNGVCEVNFQNAYQMLSPDVERRGLSGRFTMNVGDRAQLYVEGNYYNTNTFASFTPLGFNGTPTPPNNGVAAFNVWLPDYVCPTGIGTTTGMNTGCTAANGVLNPYNPYAGTGLRARAFLRSPFGRTDNPESRTLRGVIGIDGSFGDNWNYSASLTGSENALTRTQSNYLIPQRIADVVARGEFNFADPLATPQSVWDYISPVQVTKSVSKLWQAQGTLSKELFMLPGGALQAAVGVSYREESIDAPSANPGIVSLGGNQYDRFYSINSVGTAGSRNVWSGFYEIDAPILDSVELSAQGRYDKYSSGQKHFSPKFGAKFTPIKEIAIRGTWSKGFRIPSFNEAFGLPTTGYITQNVNCAAAAAFCAAHANNSYVTAPYSVGLTTVGNPGLSPEKSTAFTAGLVFEPIRNVSFTVDFWHIKVNNLISSPAGQGDAILQYYTNNGVVTVPGYTAVQGTPDPAFPGALPLLGFLQSSFVNSDSEVVQGIDFGANVSHNFGDTLRWRSNAEVSYLDKYTLTRDNGTVEKYAGTLSPCNITSCSGAPSWRAMWQNSFDVGEKLTFTLTGYWTQGLDSATVDYGAVPGDCLGNAANGYTVVYEDGTPAQCRSKDVWNADFTAIYRMNDNFTWKLDVLNVFGIKPPFDPNAAYSIFGFNPAWSGPNVLGRYFRIGAKLDF